MKNGAWSFAGTMGLTWLSYKLYTIIPFYRWGPEKFSGLGSITQQTVMVRPDLDLVYLTPNSSAQFFLVLQFKITY